MKGVDLKDLLKRVMELVMPDLRSYYRVVRKARVVKAYAFDGRYWADVQVLRNDESVDENEPVVPRVEIPVIWGGPNRGIVCPPVAGTFCDLEYYDGDPDYPRISNFRWHGNGAPNAGLGEFIIQQGNGVYIKIDAAGNMTVKTSGAYSVDVGGNISMKTAGTFAIDAAGGTNIIGPLAVDGDITGTGSIIDSGGNTSHHIHP